MVADAREVLRKVIKPTYEIDLIEIDETALGTEVVVTVPQVLRFHPIKKIAKLLHASMVGLVEFKVIPLADFVSPAGQKTIPGFAKKCEPKIILVRSCGVVNPHCLFDVERDLVTMEVLEDASRCNFRHAIPDKLLGMADG
jgi:hypothetical protein